MRLTKSGQSFILYALMENLFERFGSVLKDYIDDEGFQNAHRAQTARAHQSQKSKDKAKGTDTHEEAAHKVPDGENGRKNMHGTVHSETEKRFTGKKVRGFVYKAVPARLLEDFTTLGFASPADFSSCKKRYKNLLQKYHPDKYASSAEEQKKAADITIKIHGAFKNIEQWFKENR